MGGSDVREEFGVRVGVCGVEPLGRGGGEELEMTAAMEDEGGG